MFKRLLAYCIIGLFIVAIIFQLNSYISFISITKTTLTPSLQNERYQRDYTTLVTYVTTLMTGSLVILFTHWFQQYNFRRRKLLGHPSKRVTISLIQCWLRYEWRTLSCSWCLLDVFKMISLMAINGLILYKDMDKVIEHIDNDRNMYLQTLSNRSAQLAITNIAMSVALSAKLSLIQRYFFGIDQTIQWHVWFGRLGFLQVLYHATYQLQFNYERQGDIFATLTTNVRHITGTLMLTAMIVLMFGSHPIIRLLCYRLFRWTHITSFFVLILFGCLHHWSFYIFYVTVLVFWVTDQIDRSFITESCKIESLPGEIVKLTCQVPYQCEQLIPGQFAFISFGSTSWIKAWFHSHPFSICRMDGDHFVFYIKSIGNETSQLYQIEQEMIQARISRPLGRGFEFGDYETIVLVAEGMGITPWISVLNYIQNHTTKMRRVHVIWSIRNIDTFYAFEKEFKQDFIDIELKIQLFITGLIDPEEDYHIPNNIQLEHRPNYQEILLKIQQENKSIVMGICTHEETMAKVKNIGLFYSWDIKTERFEL